MRDIWKILGGGTQNKTDGHTQIFNNLCLAIEQDEGCSAIVCCGSRRGFAHGEGRWNGGEIHLGPKGLSGYRYFFVSQGVLCSAVK